ncbi:MAG: enoyl-CoA hydratase/isomerase family protein [Candidatus Rokubacteria bacterium]|nr:enoyl-CoA hydratase/isomerase family protein [Candidatus Rokubacteria bacterium]
MSGAICATVATGVLRVTIDRAEKRNALSRALLAELREAFERHAGDETLGVAVLTAAGERNFAAGGDLGDLATIRTREGAVEMAQQARAALDAVRRFPVPVVAALNGVALGGGAELALACDLRIAAAHAGIGFVQGQLNISTAWGGGIDLMRLLGSARALAVLGRGAVLGAEEARSLGLVDAVAAGGERFEDFVARFIAPLARQAPQVMRAFKAQALAERLGAPRAEREAIEARLFSVAWVHEDHWAAVDRLLARPR